LRAGPLPLLENYSTDLHALLSLMMVCVFVSYATDCTHIISLHDSQHRDALKRPQASALLRHPMLRSETDSALAVEQAVVQHLSERATDAYAQLVALQRCYDSLLQNVNEAAASPGPATPPADILRRHEHALSAMGISGMSPFSPTPAVRSLSSGSGYGGSARCAPADASPARQLLYSPGATHRHTGTSIPSRLPWTGPSSSRSSLPSVSSALPCAAGFGAVAESKAAAPCAPMSPSPPQQHDTGEELASVASFSGVQHVAAPGRAVSGSPTGGGLARSSQRARAPFTPARACAPPKVQQPMPSPHASDAGAESPANGPAPIDARTVPRAHLAAPSPVHCAQAAAEAQTSDITQHMQSAGSVMDDHMTVTNSTLMDPLTPYRPDGSLVKRSRPRGMSLSQGDLGGTNMLREGSGQSVACSDAHSERSQHTVEGTGLGVGAGPGAVAALGGVGAPGAPSVTSNHGTRNEAFGWQDLRTGRPGAAHEGLVDLRGHLEKHRPSPLVVADAPQSTLQVLRTDAGGDQRDLSAVAAVGAVVLALDAEGSTPAPSSRSSLDAPPVCHPTAVRSGTWQGGALGRGRLGVQLPLRSPHGSSGSSPHALASNQRSLTSDSPRPGEGGSGAFRSHSNDMALDGRSGEHSLLRGTLSALSPLAASCGQLDFAATPRARKRPLDDTGDCASIASSALHMMDGTFLGDSRVGSASAAASLAASVCGDIGGAVDIAPHSEDEEGSIYADMSSARDAAGLLPGGCGSSTPSAPSTPSRPSVPRPNKIVRRGCVEMTAQRLLQSPSSVLLQGSNRRRSSSSGANTNQAAARAAFHHTQHASFDREPEWLSRATLHATARGRGGIMGHNAAQQVAAAKLSPTRALGGGCLPPRPPTDLHADFARDESADSSPAFSGTDGLRTTSAASLKSEAADGVDRVDSLQMHPVTMGALGAAHSLRQNSNDSPDINQEIVRSRGTGVRGSPTLFTQDSMDSAGAGGTGLPAAAFSTPVMCRPGSSPMDHTPPRVGGVRVVPLLRASTPSQPLPAAVLARLQQVLSPEEAQTVDVAGRSPGQVVSPQVLGVPSSAVNAAACVQSSAPTGSPAGQLAGKDGDRVVTGLCMTGAEAQAAASRATMLLRMAQQQAHFTVGQLRAVASARKALSTPPRPGPGHDMEAVRCGSL